MRSNPRTRPVLRVNFTLEDGSALEREWTMDEATPEWARSGPPSWLMMPKRRWDHPQDPITLSGRVRPGHEEEARRSVFG
jgi:hypothetical protein